MHGLTEALFTEREQRLLPAGAERRSFPRIVAPFAVTLRGLDTAGAAFRESALACNMSACGLLVALERPVVPGTPVFVVINMWLGPRRSERGLVLAARAVVLRSELVAFRAPDHGTIFLTAVQFRRHRLLYRSARVAKPPGATGIEVAVGQRISQEG